MPKVSVIIPVYGVELYIERCARSLFEQTLDDIEYLFIDDCTPDKSIEILKLVMKDYPQREKQVVIHRMEQNSGQAKVREWGIRHATGDYLIHCDSDDWVNTDMYQSMYLKANEEKTDVVICDIIRINEKGEQRIEKCCHSVDKQVFFESALYHIDTWSLCNKLVISSSFEGIEYPQNNMGEDMAIFFQIMMKVKKISYIPKPYYYYFNNSSSITKTKTEKQIYNNFLQSIENVEIVVRHCENNTGCKIQSGLNYLKWSQKNLLLPLLHNKQYYELWRQTFKNVEYDMLKDCRQSYRIRIKCLLTILHIYPWRICVF